MVRKTKATDTLISTHRDRRCRFEQLEVRTLLAAGPPTVIGVELASSAWSDAFVSFLRQAELGSNGYAIPVGSTAQSTPLPWLNLDRVVIQFSEDVRVDAADLSISGINRVAYGFIDFRYNPQTYVATWTLSDAIDHDRLLIDLNANGLSPIRDLDASVLDGEWQNNISVKSGNGTAGGDFEFTFNVLPADVNGSGYIEYSDYTSVTSHHGTTVANPEYDPFFDIDGSGAIDSTDSQAALQRYWDEHKLPNGMPAGIFNDAPTTSGLPLLRLSNEATDVAFALLPRFNDLESGATGLTYSILSNSNQSLFDYAYIDGSTDKLVLNAAAGATGRAKVTVRATGPEGLFVDVTTTVDVNYSNVSPTLYVFLPDYVGAGTWIISGYVTDPDDDLSRFIVEFYGVYETRCAVDEYGNFEFAVYLEEQQWGDEFAVTYDLQGFPSNEVQFYFGLT